MAFAVKYDELSDPLKICLFGAVAVMARAQFIAHLFEQFGHGEVSSFVRNIPFVGDSVRITRESAHWSVLYEERLTLQG